LNACTGVELGSGFDMARKKGTEVHTERHSEVYGGLRGGITTGEPIQFQVAMKPTSSIKDVAKKGRHDPCVGIRALPILEAMTWNVLADQLLMARLNQSE
ncbi:MAG: chorismate synthase, partial [Pseudomonadota bacterium]